MEESFMAIFVICLTMSVPHAIAAAIFLYDRSYAKAREAFLWALLFFLPALLFWDLKSGEIAKPGSTQCETKSEP